MRGRNLGEGTATVLMTAHPRGQAAQETDPSYLLLLAPGERFDLTNVLEAINYEGAALLEVKSTQPLALNEGITGNVSSDGAFQGAPLPFHDLKNLDRDPRVTQAGDIRWIRLGDPATKRSNLLQANLSSNPAREIVYLLQDNQVLTQTTVDLPPMTYMQASTVYALFPTVTPAAGQTIRILTTAADPNTPVYTSSVISEIDNTTTRSQDPAMLAGTIEPLVTYSSVRVSPEGQLELNDTYTQTANFTTRTGTQLTSICVNRAGTTNTGCTWGVSGNETNTAMSQQTYTADAVGALGTRARVTVWDSTMGPSYQFIRDFTSNTTTVIEEKNGYVATYDNAKSFILGNPDLAAAIGTSGTLDGQVYTFNTWKTMWPKWFDGISTIGNDEIARIIVNDGGDGVVGGNIYVLEKTDGTKQSLRGLPEAYCDRGRTGMKATIPQ